MQNTNISLLFSCKPGSVVEMLQKAALLWWVHCCFLLLCFSNIWNYTEVVIQVPGEKKVAKWYEISFYSQALKNSVTVCETHLWLLLLVREGGGEEWHWGGTSYLSEVSRLSVSYRETRPMSESFHRNTEIPNQYEQSHTCMHTHTPPVRKSVSQHPLQASMTDWVSDWVSTAPFHVAYISVAQSHGGNNTLFENRIYTKISISF